MDTITVDVNAHFVAAGHDFSILSYRHYEQGYDYYIGALLVYGNTDLCGSWCTYESAAWSGNEIIDLAAGSDFTLFIHDIDYENYYTN